MKTWTFLVSRNFDFDYRTVISPDFLVDSGESMLLARAAGGKTTDDGIFLRREVGGRISGILTLFYRIVSVRNYEIGLAGDDVLRDEHGREISFIEGFVVNKSSDLDIVSSGIFETIHSFAIEKYKAFWEWDDFQKSFQPYESDQSLVIDEESDNHAQDGMLKAKVILPFIIKQSRVSSHKIGREIDLVGKIPLVNGRSYVEFSPSKPFILGIIAEKITQIWSLSSEALEAIREGEDKFRGYLKLKHKSFFLFEAEETIRSSSRRLITFLEKNNQNKAAFLRPSYDVSGKMEIQIRHIFPQIYHDFKEDLKTYKDNDKGVTLKFACDSNCITAITSKGILFQVDLASCLPLEREQKICNFREKLEFEKVVIRESLAVIATSDYIAVYEIPALREILHIDTTSSKRKPTSIDLSPVGSQIAIGYSKGSISILDVFDSRDIPFTDKIRVVGNCQSSVTALSFSRDEQLIAVGMKNGDLSVFDIAKPGEVNEVFNISTKNSIDSLAFNCDTSILVSSGTGSDSFAHIFKVS